MAGDNNMLLGLAMLERMVPQLKANTREQISKSGLELIKRTIDQVLVKLNAYSLKQDTIVLGNLLSVNELIGNLIDDPDFSQTDSATKDIIASKCLETLDELYLEVGHYYYDHDFDYNLRLEPLLVSIINNCIRKGYYFGVTV